MKFERYTRISDFSQNALDILMESEVQNNLPLSFICGGTTGADWLLATVKDDDGGVLLTAACTPPFNLVLYETRNRRSDAATDLLCRSLRELGFTPPGVLAEQGLAHRFAEAYTGGRFHRHMSMNIMQLDRLELVERAAGGLRPLREEDLFFAPYWELAFYADCNMDPLPFAGCLERLRTCISSGTHYVWTDGVPVSQCGRGHTTPNGELINFVYTPPHYRGRGYAGAAVATLAERLLEEGRRFCGLYADAENPVSCRLYRKLGFRDICVFDELVFDGGPGE